MSNSLKMGDVGTNVKAMQAKLRSFSKSKDDVFHIDVDGIFGPQTEAAVVFYQAQHGLFQDGIIGARTLDSLFPKPELQVVVRGKINILSDREVIDRANGCVGAPVKYHLSYPNGGADPDAAMPCDEQTAGLDCSGFNAWVHGYDRLLEGISYTLDKWDGYVNTDSKIAEAEVEGVVFTVHDEPQLGDIIVGESYRKLLAIKRTIGHEGTVVGIDNWKKNGLKGLAVVHCSPSNTKLNPDKSPIWKTNGTIWAGYKKVRFLRFNAVAAAELMAHKD